MCRRRRTKNISLKSLQNISTLTLQNVNRDDYESISQAINARKVPNLTHLSISFIENSTEIPDSNEEVIRTSFNFPALCHLTLNRFVCSPSDLHIVASSVGSSEVSKLDTSHSLGMAGSLSVMLTKHFQSLTSLVVSDCGLVSDDLSSLAKAGSQGRLPQLGHLDLSDNVGIRGHFQRLFLHGHQWGHLLSLNVKQAAWVTPGDEFHEIVKFTRLGALVHLEHLICTATNIDVHLSSSSDLKWPSVHHLHVHCAHRYGYNDHVQLYQQLTDLIQKGVFPNLNILSATSQIIPKHAISRASHNVSLSELQEASIEAMYLHDIRDVSSSQIAVHLPNDESHLKYLFELMNVNSALENTFEQKMSRSVSRMFRTFSYHGGDIVGGPLGREIIRSGLYEWLDSYHVAGRERSCLVSLGNAIIDIMLAFVTGETVDVHPLCNALQDLLILFLTSQNQR